MVKSHGTDDVGLKRHVWILVQKRTWVKYLDLLTAFLSRIPDP